MCPDQGMQTANIGNTITHRRSWESLSSTFSHLDISLAHDSCYASDEVSFTSTNPTTVDTSIISYSTPPPETPRPLKSILKRTFAETEEDEESESGYASGVEFDGLSDEDDDEMYYVTTWDDESETMSEFYGEDDASEDCSFISFEPSVRFDTHVLYIDAPPSNEDDNTDCGMTCHEMMVLAMASGRLHPEGARFYDDDEVFNDRHLREFLKSLPEEHPDDMVDLDKRIFVAYINGIHGFSDPAYKERLCSLADDLKRGQVKSPYLEPKNAINVYLDQALDHVIRTFPNVIAKEELVELVTLGEEAGLKQEFEAPSPPSPQLLKKIEDLLLERLVGGTVKIGPEELGFFAGGIAFVIKNWADHLTR
ncbi:hypothetical protein FE257_002937 [Aspergillus nanangensis]|uniref:Uncharacterized protein n=1 Tax=Aspergillus nanangensis TaxID=2582783 RepID=A0AAD4GXV8_ASPNN|nr:hypothetical protein FE257_002937 [Aspergillus nanangensis]